VTKRKPAHELTTEGAMRRLFPVEVRRYSLIEIARLEPFDRTLIPETKAGDIAREALAGEDG
jgi:hypothetical protein